jgi:hypothetical protein
MFNEEVIELAFMITTQGISHERSTDQFDLCTKRNTFLASSNLTTVSKDVSKTLYNIAESSTAEERKRYKNLTTDHPHVLCCARLLYDVVLSCCSNTPVGVIAKVEGKKYIIEDRTL